MDVSITKQTPLGRLRADDHRVPRQDLFQQFTLSEVHSLMDAQNNECGPPIGKLSPTGVRRVVCAYVVSEHQPPSTQSKDSLFVWPQAVNLGESRGMLSGQG